MPNIACMLQEIQHYTQNAEHLSREQIQKYNAQYFVEQHEIFTNRAKYPDPIVAKTYLGPHGEERTETATEPLNRIGLAYQKKIVRLGKIFQCGIPYIYNAHPKADEKAFYEAFLAVIKHNKMPFLDMQLAEYCKRFTLAGELWYVQEHPHERYGFPSKFEIKCKVLSPEAYDIYAQFDEKNNLTSVSLHLQKDTTERYQIYTATQIITYTQENGTWHKVTQPNALKKIPIVLYRQPQVEWHDVQNLIEIAERQRTYQSEANKKFGEPVLKLMGKVKSSGKTTGGGRVLQIENGGDANFIQPPNANESFMQEMRTNRQDIHEFSQTPDISEEFFSGKGNMLSGVGRKLTWLPAHLKVLENHAIYATALQRRIRIVSGFLSLIEPRLAPSATTLEIDPIITPFDLDDEVEMARTLMEANGNKPLISQQTAMRKYGIKDTEAERLQIEKESTQSLSEVQY